MSSSATGSITQTTAERIRDAGIELFATRGFAGTGIRDIAASVGITTSSLYHHLACKDELLDLVVLRSLTALNGMADHWSEASGHQPEQRLAGLVLCHAVVHATNKREVAVVDRQLDAMRPASRRRAIALRDRYEHAWRDAVDDGVRTGVFDPAEPVLASRALLGATTAIADWYRVDGQMTPVEIGTAFVTMAFDLLGATIAAPTPEPAHALDHFARRWEPT